MVEIDFDKYLAERWWPHVGPLLTNGEQQRTVRYLKVIDAVYAQQVDRYWPLVINSFCQRLIDLQELDALPALRDVDDAVLQLHNFVSPGTRTGDGLRRWFC